MSSPAFQLKFNVYDHEENMSVEMLAEYKEFKFRDSFSIPKENSLFSTKFCFANYLASVIDMLSKKLFNTLRLEHKVKYFKERPF